MPRYHFHSASGAPYRDEDGEELPGLDEAKAVALQVLTEMLPGKAGDFYDQKLFSVSVKDETGRLVVILTLLAVVDPQPAGNVPPEF